MSDENGYAVEHRPTWTVTGTTETFSTEAEARERAADLSVRASVQAFCAYKGAKPRVTSRVVEDVRAYHAWVRAGSPRAEEAAE